MPNVNSKSDLAALIYWLLTFYYLNYPCKIHSLFSRFLLWMNHLCCFGSINQRNPGVFHTEQIGENQFFSQVYSWFSCYNFEKKPGFFNSSLTLFCVLIDTLNHIEYCRYALIIFHVFSLFSELELIPNLHCRVFSLFWPLIASCVAKEKVHRLLWVAKWK